MSTAMTTTISGNSTCKFSAIATWSREHVSRAPQRLEWLLFQLDERRFKQEVRITKDAFQELLVKIENQPIFQNRSNKKAASRPPSAPGRNEEVWDLWKWSSCRNDRAIF